MRCVMFRWRVAFYLSWLLLLLPTLSWGQATTITVDISKAKIAWTWVQGSGGPVEIWAVRCGTTTRIYSLLVEIRDSAARSLPIQQITPDPGTYYCMVQAQNSYGTSGPSAEVTYKAGKTPLAVGAVQIETP